MNQHQRRPRPAGSLSLFLMVTFALLLAQTLQAGKVAAKKAEARVIYSGQFKGHVEPCG